MASCTDCPAIIPKHRHIGIKFSKSNCDKSGKHYRAQNDGCNQCPWTVARKGHYVGLGVARTSCGGVDWLAMRIKEIDS